MIEYKGRWLFGLYVEEMGTYPLLWKQLFLILYNVKSPVLPDGYQKAPEFTPGSSMVTVNDELEKSSLNHVDPVHDPETESSRAFAVKVVALERPAQFHVIQLFSLHQQLESPVNGVLIASPASHALPQPLLVSTQ